MTAEAVIVEMPKRTRLRPFCGHDLGCLSPETRNPPFAGLSCGACRARTGDPQLAKPSAGDSGEAGSDPERPRLAGDSDDDEPALAGADPDASDRAVGPAFGWYRAPTYNDDPRSQRGPSDGSRTVARWFRRWAVGSNAIPPKPGWGHGSGVQVVGGGSRASGERARSAASSGPGTGDGCCSRCSKRRACRSRLSAVTPPGADGLPWDGRVCAHLGPHVHGKRYGLPCRWGCAWRSGRGISLSAGSWLHNAARNANVPRSWPMPPACDSGLGTAGARAGARASGVPRFTRRLTSLIARVLRRTFGATRRAPRVRVRR